MRQMLSGTRSPDRVTVMESWNGHRLTVHADPPDPHNSDGPAPMDMFLFGLASCAAGTFYSILQKMHLPVEEVRIKVHAERTDSYPKVWAHIHYELEAIGDIPIGRAERALVLTEKECPASVMLAQATELTASIKVTPV